MQPPRVYSYGMCVLSTIHLLKGRYPEPNTYQEIARSHQMVGGEGANGAILLAAWGLESRLDGCFLGSETEVALRAYLGSRNVDIGLLRVEAGFGGWKDLVLCDGETRTVFGWFGQRLFGDRRLWNEPDEASVVWADVVALDPFFGDASRKVAELCRRHAKPYVTIDCKWDDPVGQAAAVLVCSREFLSREYPGRDEYGLMADYLANCPGLVVFTQGAEGLLYGKADEGRGSLASFPVKVVDSLAAGDTFRAGIVYGLAKHMTTLETLNFASAAAAICCTRFPSIFEVPTLGEIKALTG